MADSEVLAQILRVLEENRKASEAAHKLTQEQLPFDHIAQHDLLRIHLTHSPDAKEHGEDHTFTNGMRRRTDGIVDVVVKSIGVAIVICMCAGAAAWVMGVSHSNTNPIIAKELGR